MSHTGRVPHPREAITARARTGDADADYWTAVLYAAEYALLLGCQLQVVLAMTAVNASHEPARTGEPTRTSEPNRSGEPKR